MVNHNLNYIKSSFIWDWSHICSSNGLEMRATHRISVIGQQYKICIFVQNRLLLQIYVKDKWLGRDQWNFHTKNFMKISFRNFFQIEDILCSSGEMRFSFVAFEKNHTVTWHMMRKNFWSDGIGPRETTEFILEWWSGGHLYQTLWPQSMSPSTRFSKIFSHSGSWIRHGNPGGKIQASHG